jgi:uncharacterized membrane protein YfcA
MPDALSAALNTPGLFWLLFSIAAAGLVRGFTGFGTALIFVPVAGIFLAPAQVIGIMALTGIASSGVLLPRAIRDGNLGEVAILAGAAVVTIPVGLWALSFLSQDVVRWIVTIAAGLTLIALISGWRYKGQVTAPGRIAIGGSAGLLGGLTGLTGPVVILFYLARTTAAQVVRANTILFLATLDVILLVNLVIRGEIRTSSILLAALLAIPYLTTSLIGQRLFDPKLQTLYRVAAFAVIGVAVLSGLPLFH